MTETMTDDADTEHVHCWKFKLDWIRETYGPTSEQAIEYELGLHKDNDLLKERTEPGQMCMLPKGHNGPHVWTSTDEVSIAFD